MRSRPDPEYARWLERNATASVLIYGGLIALLMPLFHFVLQALPGVRPGSDSLALRCVSAGCSLALAAAVLLWPRARRHAVTLQFVSAVVAMLAVVMLVVNSGSHYAYIASGFLVIVGAQQAFYRIGDLALAFGLGFAFHIGYAALEGVLWQPMNLAAIGTFGAGYLLAFVPAALRIRTQQRELRSRLEAQRAKNELQDVQAITHLGNWTHDLRSGRVEWSRELQRIFRLDAAADRTELAGRYEAAVHPQDRANFELALGQARATRQPCTLDHRIVADDGSVRWVQLHGEFEYDQGGSPVRWVCAVLDVTGRKRAEEALVRLARFDALTGLPNRSSMHEELAQAVAQAQAAGTRFAVMFLDLDRFKDINDTLGHEVGDRLLRAAALRFSIALPYGGTLSRWGGDEFVAIVPGDAPGALAEVAQAFVRAVADPFDIDDFELVVTVSVGIARFPEDGSDAGVLIRNADSAMYKAKQELGADFAFFSGELHAVAARRHEVQGQLRRALAENRFVLHYQPLVDARSGRVRGAEALVRWIDAEGQLHAPGEFIAIAEETGLIVPLGVWILRAACEQAVTWWGQGRDLTVSINVSPRQFVRNDFVQTLERVIAETGVDPARLDLEITEAAIMSNVEPVLATLAAVRRMGIRVAIDDFGTGYSSFAYLRRFEVDTLKIDRTFVHGIEDERNLAIAKSIVTIAHTLGLGVTAEGVETAAQAGLLTELGCDTLQGYHLGRPAPAARLEDRLGAIGAADRDYPSCERLPAALSS